jgi:DNA-binding transcriptional LysR family regulator
MAAKPAPDLGSHPRISLEQWRSLAAVVEAGGYAQAAEALHKSQSSLTYAVQKLESTLGVRLFEIKGRKAVLTVVGEGMYRRARVLLDDASALERLARRATGWEAEISIAVEVLFPAWMMFACLSRFGEESPDTRIEWYETVREGTQEAIQEGKVDIAISAVIPTGMSGQPLMPVKFIPVAHPGHPLHQLGREITTRDLRKHRHLVVRDSGTQRDKKSAIVEVNQRWTVTNMTTSIGAASRGLGFAWLPADKIRTELETGQLKLLPFKDGRERVVQLYLILPDSENAGPGVQRLASILHEEVSGNCKAVSAPVSLDGEPLPQR